MRWELVAKQTGQFYHVQHPDGTIVKVPHRDLFVRGYVDRMRKYGSAANRLLWNIFRWKKATGATVM